MPATARLSHYPEAVAQAPRTRYAKCGDLDIAYQVLGDGSVDLLVLPGPLVPFDSIDAEPSLYRFHRRLASFGRVIRFDQRGMGASSRSRSSDTIGPKFWAEDALAVMDAAGCEQVTIVGSGWTGMSGLVLAADHPEAGAQHGDRERVRPRIVGARLPDRRPYR